MNEKFAHPDFGYHYRSLPPRKEGYDRPQNGAFFNSSLEASINGSRVEKARHQFDTVMTLLLLLTTGRRLEKITFVLSAIQQFSVFSNTMTFFLT